MPARKLKEFLDSESVKYVKIAHSPAYTARELAQSLHIKGSMVAKTVIVYIREKMAMAVLPANHSIDFDRFRKAVGEEDIRLATEGQFRGMFPDCEVGAMPPFGNLYGMDVYVDQHLTEDEDIFFNACSHSELVRMSYQDFERLVKPKVIKIA
ncbi:MAG: YbaK/EbsC family protein [Smithellaceae bacterium]|nr:YbaK/EbsC family protein [Syntrophaceae bacterium]MDD4240699.1 YbaK/EbsC family protein [Smithellaceae bacterium]NLX52794.1 YbaK/EbsC family protein [Deltaproteobacteria bacterium]